MTSLPPPDPRSSERDPLGFDEFIGIFVAFVTVGTVFFWALSQDDQGLNITSLISPSPSPATQPTVTPSPQATANSALILPAPTVAPTEFPDALTSVPSQTSTARRIPTVIPVPAQAPVAPASPSPVPAQPVSFRDVPQDFWARPFIDALSARGVVTGFVGDYFRPERAVTRAEFAALLQDAFDQSTGQNITTFSDVSADLWAVPAINSATSTGFLRGYPGNVFQPQQEIPKVQILVALVTGLNLQTPSSPDQILQTYQDADQIPNYAKEKVAAATQEGLVVNYPGQELLNPNQNATRAEVAAIIYQALVRSGKVPPIQSEYVVRANP